MNVLFEHIAIAVHEEDYPEWDHHLRIGLGGTAALGGDAGKLGFRGMQVPYPCGGMLELISWSLPSKPGNPIVRYLERFGPRAALHHLTFLVDSIDAARDRCRELGVEFMQGRDTKHWKEIYVRAPFFEPPKMLIQLLEADKEKAKQAAGDALPTSAGGSATDTNAPGVRIVGCRLACRDEEAARSARKLFSDLLGAKVRDDVLLWENSSMQIELMPGAAAADSCVVIEREGERSREAEDSAPPESHQLIRSVG